MLPCPAKKLPESTCSSLPSAACAVALLFLTAAPASAQWRLQPVFSGGLEVDDNARLVPEEFGQDSIQGYTVAVEGTVTYTSQLTNFSFTPEIRTRRFDESDFDSDDVFADMRFQRTGQRFNFDVRAGFSDQATRTGEVSNVDFDIEDPNELPVDDSGLLSVVRNRQSFLIAPNWSYRTSERTLVRLGGTFVDTAFDEVEGLPSNDFTTGLVNGAFEVDVSERDTIGLYGYYRNNDFNAGNRGDVTGSGFGLRYRREVSEKLEFATAIGVDRTEIASGQEPSTPVGEISLVRRFETGRLTASYQRTVGGSGRAVISERDAINLSGRRKLSERLTIGLGIRAYRTTALEDVQAAAIDERDFIQLGALFAWRFTQTFSVEADYRLSVLDRDNFDTGLIPTSSATSNRFILWLRYSPVL